jgi:hypothetical protein
VIVICSFVIDGDSTSALLHIKLVAAALKAMAHLLGFGLVQAKAAKQWTRPHRPLMAPPSTANRVGPGT